MSHDKYRWTLISFLLFLSAQSEPISTSVLQYITSYNYPTYYVFVDVSNEAFINTTPYQFKLVYPGRTGQVGTVSFESVDQPGFFLRHYNYLLYLEDASNPRNPAIFDLDATFNERDHVWYTDTISFESVNYPGYFIRHQNYRLKINQNDDSELFHLDASFKGKHTDIQKCLLISWLSSDAFCFCRYSNSFVWHDCPLLFYWRSRYLRFSISSC